MQSTDIMLPGYANKYSNFSIVGALSLKVNAPELNNKCKSRFKAVFFFYWLKESEILITCFSVVICSFIFCFDFYSGYSPINEQVLFPFWTMLLIKRNLGVWKNYLTVHSHQLLYFITEKNDKGGNGGIAEVC